MSMIAYVHTVPSKGTNWGVNGDSEQPTGMASDHRFVFFLESRKRPNLGHYLYRYFLCWLEANSRDYSTSANIAIWQSERKPPQKCRLGQLLPISWIHLREGRILPRGELRSLGTEPHVPYPLSVTSSPNLYGRMADEKGYRRELYHPADSPAAFTRGNRYRRLGNCKD